MTRDKRGYKKLGAPEEGEDREPLTKVSFKADGETLDAIEVITEDAREWGVVRPRSVAIRRAIIDSAERVRARIKLEGPKEMPPPPAKPVPPPAPSEKSKAKAHITSSRASRRR